ncbi:MAG: DUF309 domain-containing protein [Acidobacteriota bacterium]
MLNFEPDPRYQTYWRHFRSGRFWEAHEVLEGLWLESNPPDKTFYHGLIQAAASLHHLGEGNLAGAEKLAQRARQKLQAFGRAHLGVQIESLLMGLSVSLADVAAGVDREGKVGVERRRIPRVDLAYGLDPLSTSD